MTDVLSHLSMACRAALAFAVAIACAAAPVGAQESVPASPLAPADAPPPGLASQLTFFGLGAGEDDCAISPGDRAGATPLSSKCIWEVGTSNPFDFQDFDPNQDLLVQIIWPDGKVQRGNLGSERSFTWDSMPDEPIGLYTVAAAQPGRFGSGAFAIGPASMPRYIYSPDAGLPGTEFRIGLTGFAPRQRVLLHLYRSLYPGGSLGGNQLYLTTLGPVQTDQSGQAIYSLRTLASDRPGYYLIKPDPPATEPRPLHYGFSVSSPPGSPRPSLDEQRVTLVQGIVEAGDRAWAAVVAANGLDPSTLDDVVGGAWRAQIRSDIEALRAAGQHFEARLVAPVVVVNATGPESTLDPGLPGLRAEAVVREQWSIRRISGDGSVATVQLGPLTRRVVLEQDPDIYLWRIVEADPLPSAVE